MKLKTILAGAAALALAATTLIGGTAHAADPDYTVPHSSEANQEQFWVEHFKERDGVDVVCTKDDTEYNDGYLLGSPEAGHDWYALILKAGAGDGANEVFLNPVTGETYTFTDKDISHVITCMIAQTGDNGDDDGDNGDDNGDNGDDNGDDDKPEDPKKPQDPEKKPTPEKKKPTLPRTGV